MNLRQRLTLATGLHRRTDRPAMREPTRIGPWLIAIAGCVWLVSLFAVLDARDNALEGRECVAAQR